MKICFDLTVTVDRKFIPKGDTFGDSYRIALEQALLKVMGVEDVDFRGGTFK